MKLVDDWKQSWKWFSNISFALMASMHEIYNYVAAFQGMISAALFHHIMTFLCITGIILRVIDQKPKWDGVNTRQGDSHG